MAEPRPVSIRSMLDLAPEEAIAFLDAKGYRFSVSWQDTWQDEHAASFTVAKIAKLDLLRTIHVSLLDAMAEGTPFEAWKQQLQPALESAGWWGRVVDPELTGTGQTVIVGPRRLRTIYDTNLRMARATALWGRIQAGKAEMPYLRYSAVLDARTRPLHRAWHGTVLPVDHPWWQTHFPPNGWNCRCTVVQLSQRDLDRRGLKVTDVPPDNGLVPFRRRGASEVTLVPRGVDPGFGYNPGRARAEQILTKVAQSLADASAIPGAVEAALPEILADLPGGPRDQVTLAAIARLAAAGEIAALAALLGQLLGLATAATLLLDGMLATAASKRRGRKGHQGKLTAAGRESLRRHAEERRGPGGRFVDGPAEAAVVGPASRSALRNFARKQLAIGDSRDSLSMGAVLNIKQIRAATGLDLQGFTRHLTGDGVRHAIKKHGPGSVLAQRGEPVLRVADFGRIREVIASADRLIVRGATNLRRPTTLRYEATVNGQRYVFVEEVWWARKILALKTFFIVS